MAIASGGELPTSVREPRTIEETGLDPEFVKDLILKSVLFSNRLSGARMAEQLCLPHPVIGPLLRQLRQEQLLDVAGASGQLEAAFEFSVTSKGRERAHHAMQTCGYIGPAPVTLEQYTEVARAQGVAARAEVRRATVQAALAHLVLPDGLHDRLGVALNVGRSMFLFGDPGNGKTSIAEALGRCLPGEVYVPHAILVEPSGVVQVYDPACHLPIQVEERHDRRWQKCHCPFVAVGGEMTLSQLDLIWDEGAKFYQASLQMRAAGGIMLIDDFGRQPEPPRALLNRWIVPLEKGVDYLNLRTGKKIEVPFDVYTIFSTNLDPRDLCEEAFMRRIVNKVRVPDPNLQQFVEILRRVCAQKGVLFTPEGARYLLSAHYWDAENKRFRRPLRGCHPRDIMNQLVSIAAYFGRRPALEPDLIDAACSAVFASAASSEPLPVRAEEMPGDPAQPPSAISAD